MNTEPAMAAEERWPAGEAAPGRDVRRDPAGALRVLNDVELEITVELGRVRLAVRELLGLGPGSIVELDRPAGSPVDVVVNGTLIARGEVVVVDDEFGVRLTELVASEHTSGAST